MARAKRVAILTDTTMSMKGTAVWLATWVPSGVVKFDISLHCETKNEAVQWALNGLGVEHIIDNRLIGMEEARRLATRLLMP